MKTARCSLVLASILAASGLAAAGENPYLDKEGKLLHDLVLIESQGGFAGFSGQRWTIEPSGAWRREPFLNEKVRKAEATGKLSDKQLAALAKVLADEWLIELPKQLGRETGANPRVYTLKFGKHEISWTLQAGSPLPKPKPKADTPEARFARVAAAVSELVKEEEKK